MKKSVLFTAAGTSLFAIGTAVLKWPIIDTITEFLFLPLAGFIGIIFLGSFVLSVVYAWDYRKRHRFCFVPLIIQIVTVFIIFFIPFTRLWLKWNFLHYKEEREKIVEKVIAGELKPNVEYNGSLIELDSSFPLVSLGGNQIVVETNDGKPYVFFYTYRGILDNYAGFLYLPEGGDPSLFYDLYEESRTEIEKMEPGIYWVSHH
ncbi:hypothetical protein V1L52_12660 [Treponema sp. HNW]|uniref:hypothetical protein n=1 Tax=Treponema sp. HNW TaxID=3116654 RepID=UPI003D0D81E1